MDRPMGDNCYRDIPRYTYPDQLDKLLTLLNGWHPEAKVRLSGGEPTMIGGKKLTQYARVAKEHNRYVDIMTNGFRIDEVDPFVFDFINLDYHGTNKKDIDKAQFFFNRLGYKKYRIVANVAHRDLEFQRAGNISNGLKCDEMMGSLTLWQDLLIPCCVIHSIAGFENNPKIFESLRRENWTIHNPDLIETIRNWKKTIPPEVVKACTLGCWHGSNRIKWRKIE